MNDQLLIREPDTGAMPRLVAASLQSAMQCFRMRTCLMLVKPVDECSIHGKNHNFTSKTICVSLVGPFIRATILKIVTESKSFEELKEILYTCNLACYELVIVNAG